MSGQNRSTAVMQNRVEPHDSLDYFPTPPWATRALCEHVLGGKAALADQDVWEPACGEGHMARPLAEYFREVRASDVHPYGYGDVADFLWPTRKPADWVITNPPFRLGSQFINACRGTALNGFAMLVRTAFLESSERYLDIFRDKPPTIIAQFSERVVMLKGRLIRGGDVDPKTGKPVSSATAYCWLVWKRGEGGTDFVWIPPCRRHLEREQDYRSAA